MIVLSSCSPQLPLPITRENLDGLWSGQICCCAALEGGGAPGWAGRPSLHCGSRAFPTWRVFPEGRSAPARRDSDSRGKPPAGSLPRSSPRGATALTLVGGRRRGHRGAQGQLRKAGRGVELRPVGNICSHIPAAGVCPLPVPGQKSAGGGGAPPHSLSAHLCQKQIGSDADPAAVGFVCS